MHESKHVHLRQSLGTSIFTCFKKTTTVIHLAGFAINDLVSIQYIHAHRCQFFAAKIVTDFVARKSGECGFVLLQRKWSRWASLLGALDVCYRDRIGWTFRSVHLDMAHPEYSLAYVELLKAEIEFLQDLVLYLAGIIVALAVYIIANCQKWQVGDSGNSLDTMCAKRRNERSLFFHGGFGTFSQLIYTGTCLVSFRSFRLNRFGPQSSEKSLPKIIHENPVDSVSRMKNICPVIWLQISYLTMTMKSKIWWFGHSVWRLGRLLSDNKDLMWLNDWIIRSVFRSQSWKVMLFCCCCCFLLLLLLSWEGQFALTHWQLPCFLRCLGLCDFVCKKTVLNTNKNMNKKIKQIVSSSLGKKMGELPLPWLHDPHSLRTKLWFSQIWPSWIFCQVRGGKSRKPFRFALAVALCYTASSWKRHTRKDSRWWECSERKKIFHFLPMENTKMENDILSLAPYILVNPAGNTKPRGLKERHPNVGNSYSKPHTKRNKNFHWQIYRDMEGRVSSILKSDF